MTHCHSHTQPRWHLHMKASQHPVGAPLETTCGRACEGTQGARQALGTSSPAQIGIRRRGGKRGRTWAPVRGRREPMQPGARSRHTSQCGEEPLKRCVRRTHQWRPCTVEGQPTARVPSQDTRCACARPSPAQRVSTAPKRHTRAPHPWLLRLPRRLTSCSQATQLRTPRRTESPPPAGARRTSAPAAPPWPPARRRGW